MRNIRFTVLLMACALLILPAALSGCQEQLSPSQPASSAAAPTPEPEPTQEPASSSADSSDSSQEPEATGAPVQVSGFEEAFAENPIDARLSDDLDAASSSSAILKAYENAGKRWKAMIPIAYSAAMEVTAGDDRAQLEQDQKVWEETIDGIVETIREENGDGSDGKLTASRLIQERYRTTAESLCEIYFAGTGELPDFSKAMSDEPVG